ncbi:MAG: phospholipase D-like domain-containing protein, partial [Erysipelotrichaceae bacterium]
MSRFSKYSSDLSIFTNKNENGIKLSDRLNSLLTNSKYFDVLSGYFRITGFYLLANQLESVEEIRILIGLGTDKETIKAIDIFEMSGSNAVLEIKKIVKEEFSLTSDDSLEMENGVIKFCEWISSGKLKIRLCYDQNVHAKVYIIRKNPEIVPDQFGNLITGSSNFTYSGLDKNVEFNVELKDQFNVQYALDFFNELWKNSKDITSDIEETIKNETWMSNNITPYELYLKALSVYFEEEIRTRKVDYEWPEGYMNLQYQEDAVTQARKILAKHGGVLISDVVGLGKTYISAMLGKLLQG